MMKQWHFSFRHIEVPTCKEQEAPNQREKVLAKASGKAERNLKNI
jgi:hypothetical protein